MRDMRQALARRAAILGARLAPGLGERRLGRPCLVVTAGRSGSTFLMRVLDELSGLAVYPGEANRLWHPRAYPRRRFGDRVPSIWRQPGRFADYTLRHRTATDARRLRAALGGYRALMGGGGLVVKSAMIQFILPWVVEAVPGARFLHLVRDGRAVALSYGRRLLARRARGGEAPEPDAELLRQLASYWQETVDAVARADAELGLGADGRLLEVTYESLCADPAAELRRLAAYLGVAQPAAGAPLPAAFDNRNWKAASAIPAVLAEELTALMRSGLERYGYE